MFINLFQIIVCVVVTLFCYVKKTTQKFLDIDYTTNLRGIAILFVVLHHVSNTYNSNLFTPLGGIGVSMFLILSGYGLNESYHRKGLRNFWKSKLLRVIVPCWFVEIIFLFFESSHFDSIVFIKHLLCIDRNWYIRYLFYWYLLFYFSTKYFTPKRIYILAFIGLFFLFTLPEIEAEQSIGFLSGLFISEFTNIKKLICKEYLKWGGIFLLVGMSVLILKQIPIIRDYEGTVLYNVIQMIIKWNISLGVIVLYLVITNRGIKFRLFSWLGIISYELYLTHCKFLNLLNDDYSLLSILAFYSISVLAAIILYKIDKRLALKFK